MTLEIRPKPGERTVRPETILKTVCTAAITEAIMQPTQTQSKVVLAWSQYLLSINCSPPMLLVYRFAYRKPALRPFFVTSPFFLGCPMVSADALENASRHILSVPLLAATTSILLSLRKASPVMSPRHPGKMWQNLPRQAPLALSVSSLSPRALNTYSSHLTSC